MINSQLEFFDFIYLAFPEKQGNIRSLTFQVTEDCNLQCSYCYQINKTKNKMDINLAKKFIDYIFDNKNTPNFYYNEESTLGFVIDFIGGEPFLEIDLIAQIIDYFEYKFLNCGNENWLLYHIYNFSTNGTLYFTPKVQKFLNKYRGLISIGVTVDGNKTIHDSCRKFPNGEGSYDIAIQAAVNEALMHGYESTKITLAPENISYIVEGISNLVHLGFRYINIKCCFEDVWNNESALILFNQLLKLSDWIIDNQLYNKIYITFFTPSFFTPLDDFDLERGWCGVGQGKMLAVDYQGNMYPCIRFIKNSLEKDTIPILLGDLENGILGTAAQQQNHEILCSLKRKNFIEQECKDCTIATGCSWCLGCNYALTKNLSNKKINTICKPYKMIALATKYLFKKANDIENFNKIQLNYTMYKDLIEEYIFNDIVQ